MLSYFSFVVVSKTLYRYKGKNIRVNMHTTSSKMASEIKEGYHPSGIIKGNQAKISKYEEKKKQN